MEVSKTCYCQVQGNMLLGAGLTMMRDWNRDGSIFFTTMLVGISQIMNGICELCWLDHCSVYRPQGTHVVDCADPVIVIGCHFQLRHDVPGSALVHDSGICNLLYISSVATNEAIGDADIV